MKVIKLKKRFLTNMVSAALLTCSSYIPIHAADQKGPNDAEIAHVILTANRIDMETGNLANSKSENMEIKKFAQLMVTDHNSVNKQAIALANKLSVKPIDNDISKSLNKQAKEHIDRLKKINGKEFDKAYIDREVEYHQAVLDALDKILVPNVSNEELKKLMLNVRPAFVTHLEHAKQVQSTLK